MTLASGRLRLVWDQWYTLWDCDIGLGPVVGVVPYDDADFGSVETGLGPVLHTPILTSCQCSTGLGPVRVVHTMTLTSGRLRLVWDQCYTLWDCDTGLGPVVGVVLTMKLTSGRLRLVWDQWYALWDWLWVSGGWYWSRTNGVVLTMTLTSGWLRLVWDQWYILWDWLWVSMIHPRSFLLLHNSDKSRAQQNNARAEQNRAKQYRSVQARTRQSRTGRIEQSRARVRLYRAVHLMDE